MDAIELDPIVIKKLRGLFFPRAVDRELECGSKGTRFVHYTNAAAALEILRSKEFWLRDPYCMNDYTEVEHGISCVREAYRGEKIGTAFQDILNEAFPGLSEEVARIFDGSALNPRKENYIACLSEHRDSEDIHGRLSMWRAYGNGAGVAIVMKNQAIINGQDVLKLVSSPVAYLDGKGIEPEFERVVKNIRENIKFLKAQDRRLVALVIVNMLRYAALSIKHPGFEEESEWRLIYSPSVESSPYIQKDVRAIRGVPQTIYKIPLKNAPDGTITGSDLSSVIDRIIIGPTEFPFTVYRAFISILKDAGVSDFDNKVFVSQIPLRA